MKKIKSFILIRIASAVTLLYCAGHLSGYPWTPGLGENELIVIDGMKKHQFNAEGVLRTYWDFYIGFGLIIGAFLLLQGIVLWQLSGISKAPESKLKWILISFIFSFALNAFLSWTYFFSIPVIMSACIALCLCAAAFLSKP